MQQNQDKTENKALNSAPGGIMPIITDPLRSPLKTIVHIILGSILWIMISPALLLITLPFTIFRLLHHYLAHILRPDLIPIYNVVDNVLILKPTSANPMSNCCQVWKLDGRLNVPEFREHFHKLFLSTEELRESYRNLYTYFVQWGFYMFKKTLPLSALDMEKLVGEMEWNYGDQGEGDEGDEGEKLNAFIGSWMSTSNYGVNPHWAILIIHMSRSQESVLLFKCDHGLMDGYSFVNFIDKLSGVKAPYVVQDHQFSLQTKMKHLLTFPMVIMELFWKCFLLGRMPCPNNTPEIRSIVDEQWSVAFVNLDLNAIKKVRQATKSHFNTVLGAIQVGAFRRYVLEGVKNEMELPERVFVPSPSGWPNHPAMIKGTMGNHLTFTGVFLPFREGNGVKRILEAEASHLYYADVGLDVMVHWIFFKLLWAAPPVLVDWLIGFVTDIGIYPGPLGLTPLMLSGQKYQLLGHQVSSLTLPVQTPIFTRSSHVLAVPVSNSGRMEISVNGTKKLFKTQKDLERYTKVYFKEELDSLLELI